MTVPFWCLLVASLIPYVLAATTGYFKAQELGRLDNHYPRIQTLELTGIGARASAAQANAWEALTLFAVAVLVNHLGGGDADTAATLSIVWLVARIGYVVAYLADVPTARSLIFVVGLICAIGVFLGPVL